MDLAIYLLTDVNMALGVHFLVNTGLHLVLVAPQVTSIRCASAKDNTFHALQCTPDLEQVMQHLSAALNSLGWTWYSWWWRGRSQGRRWRRETARPGRSAGGWTRP